MNEQIHPHTEAPAEPLPQLPEYEHRRPEPAAQLLGPVTTGRSVEITPVATTEQERGIDSMVAHSGKRVFYLS